MGIQLLDHQTVTGLGPVDQYSPHTYRSKITRIHVEISGDELISSGDIVVVISGKAAEGSPWYTITQVVGNWMTPTTGQEACNTEDSFAIETPAFPLMKVAVDTFTSGGTTAATNTITFDAQPSHKDRILIDDDFGHHLRIVFHDAGDLADIHSLGIPVEIQSTLVNTITEAVLAINAYNDDAHPNYKGFHITSSYVAPNKIILTHDIPGTGGNSATVTLESGDGSFTQSIGGFSGGTGTDRYVSCWLDDNF